MKVPQGMKVPRGMKVPQGMKVPRGMKGAQKNNCNIGYSLQTYIHIDGQTDRTSYLKTAQKNYLICSLFQVKSRLFLCQRQYVEGVYLFIVSDSSSSFSDIFGSSCYSCS